MKCRLNRLNLTNKGDEMNFKNFRIAVAKQFDNMVKSGDLFRSSANKDELWNTYLNSFPAGANPMYKNRTEHDCNICKQFIRAVGNVIVIKSTGSIESIWDVKGVDPEYQIVANALSGLVKSKPIENVFMHYENVAGVEQNFQSTIDGTLKWDHFFVNIPPAYVVPADVAPSRLAEFRTTHDVFLRGLTDIDQESIDIVIDLIGQNSLYRGSEHKYAVTEFAKHKLGAMGQDVDKYVWDNIKINGAVSRIRNTAIGTLLIDMSEGVKIDDAVRLFETKMAGPNYKRPKAVSTPGMLKNAQKTILAEGLTTALERRYANINDITINNILFANRAAKNTITGDIFDTLIAESKKTVKSLDRVEEMSIDKFISDILPTATSLEIMMENTHINNMVSLVAPVDPTARKLFKWDNGFSWSYNGDYTDSIKERVKAAGGNTVGDLCCRLAWYNYDDLDLHLKTPNGRVIYFGNRRIGHGVLDVDMNVGGGTTREPVENIFYQNESNIPEGPYELMVNCWAKRESTNIGFDVEIDFKGEVYTYNNGSVLSSGDKIVVAKFTYSKKNGLTFAKPLNEKKVSKNVWGVQTNTFHPVTVVMNSPNYWDDKGVGNKHYFFMLENCKNDGVARGFYNEFLIPELEPHRRAMELVGSKMKTETASSQLSGLGFSSTMRNSVVCKVGGSFSRIVKIVF